MSDPNTNEPQLITEQGFMPDYFGMLGGGGEAAEETETSSSEYSETSDSSSDEDNAAGTDGAGATSSKTKREKVRFRQNVKDTLVNFCENTSVHGFQYLTSGKNFPEKFFWFLIILTCITLSTIVLNGAFNDWAENPTTSTSDSFSFPIREVQFPTITVCSDYRHDRFAIVRIMLNLFRFACDVRSEEMQGVCFKEFQVRASTIPIISLICY